MQPIYMSPERTGLVTEPVLEGMAAAGKGKTLADFDIAPFVRVAMGKDLQACRNALKPEMALYIGGMGARSKNFYNDYVKRLGYEAAAVKIQDAFLAGRRDEAVAAVPTAASTRRRWSARPSASRIGCRPGRRRQGQQHRHACCWAAPASRRLRVIAEAAL